MAVDTLLFVAGYEILLTEVHPLQLRYCKAVLAARFNSVIEVLPQSRFCKAVLAARFNSVIACNSRKRNAQYNRCNYQSVHDYNCSIVQPFAVAASAIVL